MRALVLALVCAASLVAAPVYAQLGLLGTGAAVIISMTPAHPGPHDAVHLIARSSVLDLARSSIVWSVGGKVIAQGVGATTANITAGGLGSEMRVTVEASAPDLGSATAVARIIPTQVDLLFDSDSYTPPFYRGRSLPSAGSNLILQALPRFIRPGGTVLSPSDLTYTWKKNGQVMGDISGRGRSAIIIPSPVLYATDVISVEAASSDGLLSGEASATIRAADPVLMLYEDHPLFGVLYENALGPSTFVPESEMTFAAVPYFASVQKPTDLLLGYAWRVNGTSIATDPGKPNELTLQAGEASNTALIQLALVHATNFFLQASGSWSVAFSFGGSGGGAQDAFRAFGQ